MEEASHIARVIHDTRIALEKGDSGALKELSNQTIHCSSCFQDSPTVTLSVLIYALGKLVEQQRFLVSQGWIRNKPKIISYLTLAEKAVAAEQDSAFANYITRIRTALTASSVNLKPFIIDILKKASINKAGKLYEHGLSLGKTAELLGVSTWDLSEYTAQREFTFDSYDVRKRAAFVREFFA